MPNQPDGRINIDQLWVQLYVGTIYYELNEFEKSASN